MCINHIRVYIQLISNTWMEKCSCSVDLIYILLIPKAVLCWIWVYNGKAQSLFKQPLKMVALIMIMNTSQSSLYISKSIYYTWNYIYVHLNIITNSKHNGIHSVTVYTNTYIIMYTNIQLTYYFGRTRRWCITVYIVTPSTSNICISTQNKNMRKFLRFFFAMHFPVHYIYKYENDNTYIDIQIYIYTYTYRTMMIELIHTHTAFITMCSSSRPVYITATTFHCVL